MKLDTRIPGEHCQHTASSILVCPIQTVHQTILSEPHILRELLDQLFCEEIMCTSVFRQNLFPFLTENHAELKKNKNKIDSDVSDVDLFFDISLRVSPAPERKCEKGVSELFFE